MSVSSNQLGTILVLKTHLGTKCKGKVLLDGALYQNLRPCFITVQFWMLLFLLQNTYNQDSLHAVELSELYWKICLGCAVSKLGLKCKPGTKGLPISKSSLYKPKRFHFKNFTFQI